MVSLLSEDVIAGTGESVLAAGAGEDALLQTWRLFR